MKKESHVINEIKSSNFMVKNEKFFKELKNELDNNV